MARKPKENTEAPAEGTNKTTPEAAAPEAAAVAIPSPVGTLSTAVRKPATVKLAGGTVREDF